MEKCLIRDWQGQEAGQAVVELKGARARSAVDLMHRAVIRQLAHQRQGTASTLTRAEVRGGGRKPYKQKGTGRARQGSIRTPLRPGGGVVFGPKPRSYSLQMNKKERRLALRTALMARLDDITVVRGFGTGIEEPRTKEIISALERFGIDKKSKVLIILDNPNQAILHSVRNIKKIKLMQANQLNVFDLLHANKLLVSEEALTKIQEVYSDG